MKKITVLLSNKCNFTCNHCMSSSGNIIDGELTIEEIKSALFKLKQIGVTSIVLSGGEPLIYPHFASVLEYLHKENLNISILTNGMGINRKKLDLLKQHNTQSIAVSVYSSQIIDTGNNDKYYASLFDKMMMIQESEIPYKVTIPLTDEDADFAYYICTEIAEKRLTPSKVRIYMATEVGRGIHKVKSPSKNMWQSLITKLKGNENIVKLPIKYGSYWESETPVNRCPIGFSNIEGDTRSHIDPHMDANGDLYMCGLLIRNQEHIVANIKADSKYDILKKINTYYDFIRESDSLAGKCPALPLRSISDGCNICPILNNNKIN